LQSVNALNSVYEIPFQAETRLDLNKAA